MIDFHIDTARRLVITRAAGHVSYTDVVNHLQRIFRDAKFDPEYNALIVATDVSAVPSPTSIALISPLLKAWSKQRAGAKWAFVMPNAETKALVEEALHNLKLTAVSARCFNTEGAAFAWLETTSVSPRVV